MADKQQGPRKASQLLGEGTPRREVEMIGRLIEDQGENSSLFLLSWNLWGEKIPHEFPECSESIPLAIADYKKIQGGCVAPPGIKTRTV